MPRIVYLTATSADGYIADRDGSLDWLFAVPSVDDPGWQPFLDSVGVLVMGATTYEWVLQHEQMLEHPERWRAYYDLRPSFVLTHRELPRIPGIDIRFVRGDVAELAADLVDAAGGRDIWIVGGGDLAGQFDDARLLDEIRLSVMPVLLGEGAPLLPRRIEADRLTLRSVSQLGQRAQLVFDVDRSR